jgi:hypothetical protein
LGAFRKKCSTLLIVFRLPGFLLQLRFKHKQFRERRIRVRRPFAWPLFPGAETLPAPFPLLSYARAILLARRLAAAMASEARFLFAFAPLATLLMATLEGPGRGCGLILRKRRNPGTSAIRRFPGNRFARRRVLRGCFRRRGGDTRGRRSVAPFKGFLACPCLRRPARMLLPVRPPNFDQRLFGRRCLHGIRRPNCVWLGLRGMIRLKLVRGRERRI